MRRNRVVYKSMFFTDKATALTFQEEHGGVFYSGLFDSDTLGAYNVEAALRGLTDIEREVCPYVIAWNEVENARA